MRDVVYMELDPSAGERKVILEYVEDLHVSYPHKMDRPEVSVVIPSLDGGEMLLDALRSVAGETIERIVVDNGSTDGSADAAGRSCPGTRVLRAETNLGFAEACRRG